jgi:hypothetical protein
MHFPVILNEPNQYGATNVGVAIGLIKKVQYKPSDKLDVGFHRSSLSTRLHVFLNILFGLCWSMFIYDRLISLSLVSPDG